MLRLLLWLALSFTICTQGYARYLSLPSHLVSISSDQGQQLFRQAELADDFWSLSQYFVTQKTLAYCGIASSVMALNALGVKPPATPAYAPYAMFTQENIFTDKVLRVVTPTQVNLQGMTLGELGKLLRTFPVKTLVVYANQSSIKQFKQEAIAALEQPGQIILVNFDRATLGQKGPGHISPLGAYNAKTDRFLLLDVSRYKYPPVWVKSNDLWQAINTIDATAKAHRGYVVITKD